MKKYRPFTDKWIKIKKMIKGLRRKKKRKGYSFQEYLDAFYEPAASDEFKRLDKE